MAVIGRVALYLLLFLTCPSFAQESSRIVVPSQVVALVRPVLDELQTYRTKGGDPNRLSDRFFSLAKQNGLFVDEALVVILCFDAMGESQEDDDAVIARGKKMLRYLAKYRNHTPKIASGKYDSLLKSSSRKEEHFRSAVKAIQHGWRGTWDNPEG